MQHFPTPSDTSKALIGAIQACQKDEEDKSNGVSTTTHCSAAQWVKEVQMRMQIAALRHHHHLDHIIIVIIIVIITVIVTIIILKPK